MALSKENDKCYIDTDAVIYYQKNWEVETYKNFLNNSTLVPPDPELDDYNIKNFPKVFEIIKKENPKFLYFTHFGKFSYKENEIINLPQF